MSLAPLLSAGKSLVDFQADRGRYRMSVPGALPKFGRGIDEVATKTDLSGASSKTQKTEPIAQPNPGRTAQSRNAGKHWITRLMGAFARVRKVRPRKGARSASIPRFGKPAVQGELLLENIKVVRNDLSDADLEIVQPAAAPQQINAQEQVEGSGNGWRRVSARFFAVKT